MLSTCMHAKVNRGLIFTRVAVVEVGSCCARDLGHPQSPKSTRDVTGNSKQDYKRRSAEKIVRPRNTVKTGIFVAAKLCTPSTTAAKATRTQQHVRERKSNNSRNAQSRGEDNTRTLMQYNDCWWPDSNMYQWLEADSGDWGAILRGHFAAIFSTPHQTRVSSYHW